MTDKVSGSLLIGRNEAHEIIVNHPDLQPDVHGVGHIVFSIGQARNLAALLTTHAAYAERESQHLELGVLPAIKIFNMNGCDWYAAATEEDALSEMAAINCFPPTPEGLAKMREQYAVEGVSAVSDEDLNRLRFGEEDDETGEVEVCSFRARLDKMIAEGEEFPCFFASTEC